MCHPMIGRSKSKLGFESNKLSNEIKTILYEQRSKLLVPIQVFHHNFISYDTKDQDFNTTS
jgi:hypothetical protein